MEAAAFASEINPDDLHMHRVIAYLGQEAEEGRNVREVQVVVAQHIAAARDLCAGEPGGELLFCVRDGKVRADVLNFRGPDPRFEHELHGFFPRCVEDQLCTRKRVRHRGKEHPDLFAQEIVEHTGGEEDRAVCRVDFFKPRGVIQVAGDVLFALSEADAGIAISTGAAIAREIADITIASEDLFELVTLRRLSAALMARIHRDYRFIVSFNFSLIVLGVAGILPPTTSALLHNTSTLAISLKSMTNLLPAQEPEHQ